MGPKKGAEMCVRSNRMTGMRVESHCARRGDMRTCSPPTSPITPSTTNPTAAQCAKKCGTATNEENQRGIRSERALLGN